MSKLITLLLTATLLLAAGCANQTPPPAPNNVPTQAPAAPADDATTPAENQTPAAPADTGAIDAPTEPANAPAEPTNTPSSTPVLSVDETMSSYCQYKTEEEALSIDIERLNAQYRNRKIDEDTFLEQKRILVDAKRTADNEADRLEYSLPRFVPADGWVDAEDPKALRQLMRQLEQQEDEVERSLDRLEDDYRFGDITRDEFTAQYSPLTQEEYHLDEQLDYLEDTLEWLGYDD